MNLLKMVAMAAIAILIAGCGEKEKTCFFTSRDGRLLQKGACVIWKEACDAKVGEKAHVGRVDELEDTDQGVKVIIRFNAKSGDDIHEGVAARIVNDPKFSPRAFVLLVNGNDAVKPVVKDGAEIPEARESIIEKSLSMFLDWLQNVHADTLVGTVILVGIFIIVMMFVGKMLKFVFSLLAVGVVCYACMSVGAGWSGYKEGLDSAGVSAKNAKAWLGEHCDDLKSLLKSVSGD